MKKTWNMMASIVLILCCCLTCFSHLANRFFQQDIGGIMNTEIDTSGAIDAIFQHIEQYIPPANIDKVNQLKMDAKKSLNDAVARVSQSMVEDAINGTSQLNMDKVLSDVIKQSEEQLTKNIKNKQVQAQIRTIMDQQIPTTSIQPQYKDVVNAIHQRIPSSLRSILHVGVIMAKKSVQLTFAVIALISLLLLILTNLRKMRWLFPVGVSTLISGVFLLFAGIIMSVCFEQLIRQLSFSVATLHDIDFHIIIYFGAILSAVGIVCLFVRMLFAYDSREEYIG